MKKLTKHRIKAWTERIPRKKRFLLYLLTILCLVFLFYIFIGAPALSWQHRYRRVEKAHLIGPGQILGYEEVSGIAFSKVVVAKTIYGVIVCHIDEYAEDYGLLLYLPQRGRITVTAAPQLLAPMEFDSEMDTVTVFAVDDYPEAVRAELDLELYWQQQQDEEAVRPVFHLSAQREQEGYFRFDAPFESLDEENPERKALKLFSDYTRNYPQWRDQWIIPENAYKATVRLYNSGGQLIAEESLYLFEE